MKRDLAVYDCRGKFRDRSIAGLILMLASAIFVVPFVVTNTIEALLWQSIVFMILGSVGFGLGMALVWPKLLAEKLAFVRGKAVVVFIVFWFVCCLVGMVIFSHVSPRPKGLLSKPGSKITINVGRTILAIDGLYDTHLITCTFIPTDRQKLWHFDPIAHHKTRNSFSKAEWRKDRNTLSLVDRYDRTITPQHTMILRKRDELWNTSLKFRVELSVTWPQQVSTMRYEAKNRTASTIVNINTVSRSVILTDRIRSFFLLAAYVPLSLLAASVNAKCVSCPRFMHQLMHKRLW
ncbi:hypothetical protein ACFL5F_04290 [Planctomycetota bacterium]